jgi:nitroreductase
MQAYLGLTAALIQAEQLGLDATPHEGFKLQQLEAYLKKHHLLDPEVETVAIGLALGKVDLTKSHPNNQEKVRKTFEDYATIVE